MKTGEELSPEVFKLGPVKEKKTLVNSRVCSQSQGCLCVSPVLSARHGAKGRLRTGVWIFLR